MCVPGSRENIVIGVKTISNKYLKLITPYSYNCMRRYKRSIL